MSTPLPFSHAAERNRAPILEVLRVAFADCHAVLEIGSGSGQHAEAFATALPALCWQPSEQPPMLDGLRRRCQALDLPGLLPPLPLDVTDAGHWAALRAAAPAAGYDAVYTANTLHIMAWSAVQALFQALPTVLADDACLAIYGPFRIGGAHTSASNAAFDAALRESAAHRGVRDLEAVDALAAAAGLRRVANHALPANNRCIIWRRGGAT